MGAKYSVGNKVRIKSNGVFGKIYDPQIIPLESVTGEIIESTDIVAFIGSSEAHLKKSGDHITVYHYTVKINEQVTLHDVVEESLEIIN